MVPRAGARVTHHRLIEPIGEGGSAVVWKALDLELDREVALKFLPEDLESDPERLSGLRREARALAALNHPNIVTVHAIERHGEQSFITMEYVPGRRLGDLIPEDGLDPERWFPWAISLVRAVAAAHERDIVHRDIKPGNVIVGEDGRLRVLDFGLAAGSRREDSLENPPGEPKADLTGLPEPDDDVTRTLDPTGGIVGTLHYMSPEQLAGRPADPRSDVFSLGIVLYEMACGSKPFTGPKPADVVAAILRCDATPLRTRKPSTPQHLARVVERCLVHDTRSRPATAAVLLRDLLRSQRRQTADAGSRQPSIAVLPFADMSEARDQDYFCEGLSEEIINALNRVRGLRVASRTSSFQLARAGLDIREIGDRLEVDTLMEGSVRKAGNHLRVTATLVNVADGYHVWTRRFDSELSDIFAIQDQIAQDLVQALQVKLNPSERRALRQVATGDVAAFEDYLRGRKFFNRYDRTSVECALRMFGRAIAADPTYALAHAGISDGHAYLYMHAGHREVDRLDAEQASRRALELDPELAEAHTSRAVALSISERFDEAEREFETALALNPKLFDAAFAYARQAFVRRDTAKAIELYARASALRPDDYQCPLLVAQTFADLGRDEEAREERLRGIDNAEQCLELNPDDIRALYMGANGLVALGELDRGLEWADRARDIAPDDPMLLYNLACIYALAERPARALECLEQAVDGGFNHVGWLRGDSNLDSIRGEARFGELLASIERR